MGGTGSCLIWICGGLLKINERYFLEQDLNFMKKKNCENLPCRVVATSPHLANPLHTLASPFLIHFRHYFSSALPPRDGKPTPNSHSNYCKPLRYIAVVTSNYLYTCIALVLVFTNNTNSTMPPFDFSLNETETLDSQILDLLFQTS